LNTVVAISNGRLFIVFSVDKALRYPPFLMEVIL